ncbi:Pal1 cell morphology protein-domain-containing protein [Limtongia smithiae]|uniref:Pal1 cell morphology protein-domain-containing protein n=1 Tax=Limtongia smithiae TaxID=1125753 RepID=UPI0034CFF6F8
MAAFASNNPFRADVASPPRSLPSVSPLVSPRAQPPPAMARTRPPPLLRSNNPFLDPVFVVQQASPPLVDLSARDSAAGTSDNETDVFDERAGRPMRRTTSESAASVSVSVRTHRETRDSGSRSHSAAVSTRSTSSAAAPAVAPLSGSGGAMGPPLPPPRARHHHSRPSVSQGGDASPTSDRDARTTERHEHRKHRHRSSSNRLSKDLSSAPAPTTSTDPFASPSANAAASSSTSKSRSHKKHSSKRSVNLDKIDKLDVTGIFGTGFHHDGPFDACIPSRNKNNSKAPMLAFPKDSENNSLAPPRYMADNPKMSQAVALAIEGINGTSSVQFDPVQKADPVHGEVSLGLGSSTFLEGTPASRAAIQQQSMRTKESESAVVDFSKVGYGADTTSLASGSAGGLTRKRSIVQKIIGINLKPLPSPTEHSASSSPSTSSPTKTPLPEIPPRRRMRSYSTDDTTPTARPQYSAILEEPSSHQAKSSVVMASSSMLSGSAPRMIRQASSPGTASAPLSPSFPPPHASHPHHQHHGDAVAAIAAGTDAAAAPPPNGLLKRVRSMKVSSSRRE